MKITDITQNDWSNYVGLLTESQKNQLIGQQYATDSFFNPIKDDNDNWIISIQEIVYCEFQNFIWLKNLDIIPLVPKVFKNFNNTIK